MELVIYRDYEAQRGDIIEEHGTKLEVVACIEMDDRMSEELAGKGLNSYAGRRFKIVAIPLRDISIQTSDPEV